MECRSESCDPSVAADSLRLTLRLVRSPRQRRSMPVGSEKMSTAKSIRIRHRVADSHAKGLVDTSVVIDLDHLADANLPAEIAISAITLAELAAGPHATRDPEERAARQERLQRAEATFDALPFDDEAARAYGRIYAAVVAAGRKARGPRALDLQIASIALANGLALYTRNPKDLRSVEHLIEIIAV
jgi:predicted nucleic acid-binding protein